MEFTPIDMKTWPRAQTFRFFSGEKNTDLCATVDVDVTRLVETVKGNALKFFPVYMWLVTRELIKQPEMRTGMLGGVLGHFDGLCPSFPVFHEETGNITSLWLEYRENFGDFYADYLSVTEKFGNTTNRFIARRDLPTPANSYIISCIPWMHYSHFSIHRTPGAFQYLPSVEAGKYVQEGDRKVIPVTLTCNHGVADGYHMSVFFDGLQKAADSFSPGSAL